jgi:hypothetical protein
MVYYTEYKRKMITDMEDIKNTLQKNLNDMDLDNVDIKDKMQAVVDNAKADVDSAIDKVNSYYYRH